MTKRLLAGLALLLFIAAPTIIFAATITKTWTNAWLTDASLRNTIDDRMNDFSVAVQERSQNGGRYWPTSNDSKSGINAVQAANFVSGEWAVYRSDLTNKAIAVSDSNVNINNATTVNSIFTATGIVSMPSAVSTGAITATGVITTPSIIANDISSSNDKRIIIGVIAGRGDGGSPDLEGPAFYIPQGVTGTIVEIEGSTDGVFVGGGSVILKKLSPTWTADSDTTSCVSSGTTLATLTPSGKRHIRTTTISTPTVAAGDVLCLDRSGSTGPYAQYNIYIKAEW